MTRDILPSLEEMKKHLDPFGLAALQFKFSPGRWEYVCLHLSTRKDTLYDGICIFVKDVDSSEKTFLHVSKRKYDKARDELLSKISAIAREDGQLVTEAKWVD